MSWLQVVFATAVTKPGHGNIAPLAIGFTLFASAFVGMMHSLQPASACWPATSEPVQGVLLKDCRALKRCVSMQEDLRQAQH